MSHSLPGDRTQCVWHWIRNVHCPRHSVPLVTLTPGHWHCGTQTQPSGNMRRLSHSSSKTWMFDLRQQDVTSACSTWPLWPLIAGCDLWPQLPDGTFVPGVHIAAGWTVIGLRKVFRVRERTQHPGTYSQTLWGQGDVNLTITLTALKHGRVVHVLMNCSQWITLFLWHLAKDGFKNTTWGYIFNDLTQNWFGYISLWHFSVKSWFPYLTGPGLCTDVRILCIASSSLMIPHQIWRQGYTDYNPDHWLQSWQLTTIISTDNIR